MFNGKVDFQDVMAVTARKLCPVPLEEQMEKICRLHPAGIILREKDLPEAEYEALCLRAAEICARYGVVCIAHSFPDAARRAGISRIHLPLWRLEEWHGTEKLRGMERIGVSVHSQEEALLASQLGASYLTAGHIFATDCKKGLKPRGTEFLRRICESVDIPVWAIGGIALDADKIKEVKDCGAAGACIMSGMMKL